MKLIAQKRELSSKLFRFMAPIISILVAGWGLPMTTRPRRTPASMPKP